MKLSKAQQEVLNEAKARIDYARKHDFYDWYRNGYSWFRDKSNEAIDEWLAKNDATEHKIGGTEYATKHYEMNKAGIDYLCHASSLTIRKLESLGLIEIIKDSAGEYYGFDVIKIVNY